MSEIKTYPEMNEKIVAILVLDGSQKCLYAAQLIVEQLVEIASLKKQIDSTERNFTDDGHGDGSRTMRKRSQHVSELRDALMSLPFYAYDKELAKGRPSDTDSYRRAWEYFCKECHKYIDKILKKRMDD